MNGFEFNWQAAWDAIPFLLTGLPLTLEIAFGGLAIGFAIGLIFGLMRISSLAPIRIIAITYIEIFRGTPVIVQVLFIFYGLPQIFGYIPAVTASIAAIALNSGAYISEIVRGSVQSIDRGQREAGISLGLSRTQTFRYIIWPRAFRRMIPALGNQAIISIKDTAIFTIIGVAEIVQRGQVYIASTFNALETYLMVALLYLTITLSLSLLLRFIEKRGVAENL